ncbi:hypothetical protein ACRAWF_11115 [Streptomyces sp. L7]
MAVRGSLRSNYLTQGGWRSQTGIATIDPQGLFPIPTLNGGNGSGSIPAQVELGILAQESNLWQAESRLHPRPDGQPARRGRRLLRPRRQGGSRRLTTGQSTGRRPTAATESARSPTACAWPVTRRPTTTGTRRPHCRQPCKSADGTSTTPPTSPPR